jgi:hypothetical protein
MPIQAPIQIDELTKYNCPQVVQFQFWSRNHLNLLQKWHITRKNYLPRSLKLAQTNRALFHTIDKERWNTFFEHKLKKHDSKCKCCKLVLETVQSFTNFFACVPHKMDVSALVKLLSPQNHKGSLRFHPCNIFVDHRYINVPFLRIHFNPESYVDEKPEIVCWNKEDQCVCAIDPQKNWLWPGKVFHLFLTFFAHLCGPLMKQICIEAGKTSQVCVFCNLPLSDPISKHHGYGKKCAQNHQLPWPLMEPKSKKRKCDIPFDPIRI